MLLNPFKFKKLKTVLFNRIVELNTEVEDLKAQLDWERNNLRNTEACVESYKNLDKAWRDLEKSWKAVDESRIRKNQYLTEIILRSNLSDEFSVTDLSMLDE